MQSLTQYCYEKKLVDHQNKINYTNELDRIRGYMSENDSRFPIGTRGRLAKRAEELKQLGAKIIVKLLLYIIFSKDYIY